MRGHGLTRLAFKGPGRMPAQAIRIRIRIRIREPSRTILDHRATRKHARNQQMHGKWTSERWQARRSRRSPAILAWRRSVFFRREPRGYIMRKRMSGDCREISS
eukprot:108359-Pyramimonas_sp.AAC.1